MNYLDNSYDIATQILVKTAEEEGIDLNELSDDEIQELLSDIREEVSDRADESGGEGGEEPKTAGLTTADVALELSKVAAANGIDLSQVSREEYAEAFDKLASEMSNPHYWETQEKVAEADFAGRVMARAFNDELEKIADARTWSPQKRRAVEAKRNAMLAERVRAGDFPKMEESISATRHSAADARKFKAQERLARIRSANMPHKRLGRAVTDAVSEYNKGRALGGGRLSALAEAAKKHKGVAAGAVGLTALGLGGAALGAKKALEKKSFDETFEADALNLAAHLIGETNVEFSKLAAAGDAGYDALVEERAYEILAENGWV